jgi:hypothetical protein
MPRILTLLKYSYTNRRSTALVVYSALAAVWVAGWLVLWTFGLTYAEPEGDGGPLDFFARTCICSTVVLAICVLPVVIQLAWALKVQKEEAAGAPPPWQGYVTVPPLQAPPPPLAYPPPFPPDGESDVARRLEEEKSRTRELEYENTLLKLRVRDQEAEPRQMSTVERLVEAQGLELEKRYADAARIYEELGRWDDAGRVRMLEIRGKP